MYYLSSLNYTTDGKKLYIVTDTSNNSSVTLFQEELFNFLKGNGFTSVRGVRYTGSRLVCRVTNPLIETINDFAANTEFKLLMESPNSNTYVEVSYRKLRESADGQGWFFECINQVNPNTKKCKVIKFNKSYLIEHKDVQLV
jgi:hypothetical protein